MFCWNTLRKVIAWRFISITSASLLAWPFMESYSRSLTITALINPAMTMIHYVFEKYWSQRYEN